MVDPLNKPQPSGLLLTLPYGGCPHVPLSILQLQSMGYWMPMRGSCSNWWQCSGRVIAHQGHAERPSGVLKSTVPRALWAACNAAPAGRVLRQWRQAGHNLLPCSFDQIGEGNLRTTFQEPADHCGQVMWHEPSMCSQEANRSLKEQSSVFSQTIGYTTSALLRISKEQSKERLAWNGRTSVLRAKWTCVFCSHTKPVLVFDALGHLP